MSDEKRSDYATDAEIDAALSQHPIFGAAMRGELQSYSVAAPFGIHVDRKVPPGTVIAMHGKVVVGAILSNGEVLGTAELRERLMQTLEEQALHRELSTPPH